MSSIDERVVRMEFENRTFESGVSQTMSTLEKLNEALKFRGATAGFEGIQKASATLNFAPLNDSLWQVQQNFSFFGEFVEQLFSRISNRIITLGSQAIRELTIAPLMAGFSEYELQMTSTQTIMASTGASIEEVTGYLDELNTYADKTIYSFSDMTANIGKFTNAGVDLDVAVKAIQGISNEAAVSGANAQEASRAMYNFAQALSAGYVKLIDWKSIENANMATVEFKTQLLETAAQMGTVEKTADGMYRVLTKNGQGGTMSELIDATHMFNDSLAYQWMTSEVLTTTLGRYADETTEIGKKAFAAATEVKTFSQLIDTVKESLGSGWTKSFSYVIGNLEEAKVLWTGVNNEINAILDPIAEAREEMLKFWHDNGGRDKAIQAIADAFQGLKAIMSTIGDSFERIFPPLTGEKLVEITNKIGELASGFRDFVTDSMFLSDLSIMFENIFAVIRRLGDVALGLLGNLSPLIGIFADFGGSLYEAVYWLTLFLGGVAKSEDPLKYFSMNASSLSHVVENVVIGVENLVKALLDFVGIHIEGNPITDLFEKIRSFFSNRFDTSIFSKLSDVGKKILDIFSKLGPLLSNAFGTITGWLGNGLSFFGDVLGSFADNVLNLVNTLGDVAGSFDILGGIEAVLSGFGSVVEWVGEKVATFASWIGENLPKVFEFLASDELHGIITNFTSLMGGGLLLSLRNFVETLNKSKSEKSGGLADTLSNLFSGFNELPEKIGSTLDSLTDALSGLQEKVKGDVVRNIAIAVGILAGSLLLLSSIDPDHLASGISGIASAMGVLVGTFKALESSSGVAVASGMASVSTTLIKMAIAVGILAVAMRLLAKLDMDELERGLVGIGGAMGVLVAGASLLARFGGTIQNSAKGMVSMAVAVGILALSVYGLSKLDMDELGRGLEGVVGLMVAAAVASIAMSNFSGVEKSAKGMVGFAIAIGLLVLSVKALSKMNIDELERGLIGVAGLLGAVAIAVTIMEAGAYFGSMSMGAVATILALVAAVKILEGTVTTFAALDSDSLARGLIGVAGILIAISAFAAIVGKISISAGAIVGVVVLAGVITVLSNVVQSLGGMSLSAIGTGLLGLAGSLAAMVIALKVLQTDSAGLLIGAAALGVMAIAMRIFVPVLERFAAMDIGDIFKSLITLGASLAVLGLASVALDAIAPAILVASVAIGAFGIACGIFGAGTAIAAAGITAFAAALAAAGAGIVASAGIISTGIQTLIVAIVVGFFRGIAEGAVALLEGFGEILAALGVAIHAVGDFIVENIPYVLSVVATLIISVLSLIPTFIPQLAEVVGQLIVALVVVIVTWVPTIAAVLIEGVITLINSVANGIRDNTEAILAAVRNILSSIIELVLTALADIVRLIPGVGDTLAGFIEDGKDTVRQALAPESFEQMGNDAMTGAADGITNGSVELNAAADQAGTGAVDAFIGPLQQGDAGEAANMFALTTIPGFEDGLPLTEEQAQMYTDLFNTTLANGDASPYAQDFAFSAVDGLGSVDTLFDNAAGIGTDAYINGVADADATKAGQAVGYTGAAGAKSSPVVRAYTDSGTGGGSAYKGSVGSVDASPEGEQLALTGASGASSSNAIQAYTDAGSEGTGKYKGVVGGTDASAEGEALAGSAASGAGSEESKQKFGASGVNDIVSFANSLKSDVLPAAGKDAADRAASGAGSEGSKQKFGASGVNDVIAFTTAMKNASVYPYGQDVADRAASGAHDNAYKMGNVGTYLVDGLVTKLTDHVARERAYSAGVGLATAARYGVENTLQIKSPSRVMMRIGNYVTQGFVNGIEALSGTVYSTSTDVGQQAIDGINGTLGMMAKHLGDDIDYDPTIRPVMDLSEIQNGISQMNRIVDNGTPAPLLGVGFDAYPQRMMASMAQVAPNPFSSGAASESTTYNITIDGNALSSDARLMDAFEGFMREVVRKADM